MCIREKVAERRVAAGAGSPGGAPTTRSIEGCCSSQRASSWKGLIGSMPSQTTWPGATAATASTTVSSAPRIARKLPSRRISIGAPCPSFWAARRMRRLVDPLDRRAAARLAHHAGVDHAVHRHVVNKDRFAKHLGGEIDPRRAAADDPMLAGLLDRRPAAGMAREIDRRRRATNNPGRSLRRGGISRRRAPPGRRAHSRTPQRRGRETGHAPRRKRGAARRRRIGSTGCPRCSLRWASDRYRRSAAGGARARHRAPRRRSAASRSGRPGRSRPCRSQP